MSVSTVKRSRTRRVGESAYGVLLLVRHAMTVVVVLLVLAAGVWKSWDSAQHAMFTKGRTQGTVTIERCGSDWCSGPFSPADGPSTPRTEVTIDKVASQKSGEVLQVVVRPGTDTAVRTGPSGILYSWVPFAGSLLLTAFLVAGGLRLRRTGWALGLLGALLLGAAFWTL